MKKHVIELRMGWDEEQEDYYLNGEYLLNSNHDTDGWAGMAAKREAIKTICEKTGIEFKEVYVEDEE